MTTVVVVGGGVGGLSTALFLARRGRAVTLLERDGQGPPATLDGVGGWVRRGTPQAGQSHAFVARCRQLFAAEAPDVLVALRDAGVEEIHLGDTPPPTLAAPPDPDHDLVVLASRRTVFEWALRRIVDTEPGIAVRSGVAARALRTEPGPGGTPTVTGVALDDGSWLAADVVVDAGGRRSAVGGSLGDVSLPEERVVPCGIAYCSQFFQRRTGAPRPRLNRGYVAGGSFDRYSCLVFPADNGTFSVTFGTLPEDREMRCLNDERGFLAAAGSVPAVSEWLDPAGAFPISGVATMRGLENRFRRLVRDQRPVVLGLLAVGDAACITNPAHTRGSTLAVESAQAVARAIHEHEDGESRALAVDAELRRTSEPRFWDSVEQDAMRLDRWRPADEAAPRPSSSGRPRITNAAANAAAQRDPVVWRAFTRAQQLLELPDAVLEDPDVVARTQAVLASGWRSPVLEAPSRDELIAVAEAATASRLALDPTG